MTPEAPVPLYAAGAHAVGRALGVFAAAIVALGLLSGAWELAHAPSITTLIGLTLFATIGWYATRTLLRARAILGTSEGIIVNGRPRQRIAVPWSRVGPVDSSTASFNPVLRTYSVSIEGEPRRVYFFASPHELRRWEALRR